MRPSRAAEPAGRATADTTRSTRTFAANTTTGHETSAFPVRRVRFDFVWIERFSATSADAAGTSANRHCAQITARRVSYASAAESAARCATAAAAAARRTAGRWDAPW